MNRTYRPRNCARSAPWRRWSRSELPRSASSSLGWCRRRTGCTPDTRSGGNLGSTQGARPVLRRQDGAVREAADVAAVSLWLQLARFLS